MKISKTLMKNFLAGIFLGICLILIVSTVYAFTLLPAGVISDPTFRPGEGDVQLPGGICIKQIYSGVVECLKGFYIVGIEGQEGKLLNPSPPPPSGVVICCTAD